jgi:peptidoglycan hydrolase-like protein with peptidoglycan-binding domain
MRVSFISLVVTIVVLSYGTYASAQNIQFTATLSFGSRGTQVVALQQSLNNDPNTRVANTGPGSPGNETNYFGPLTKNAVIRFQEKYASDILAPVGLARGNGYVGLYTRAKLNLLSTLTANTGGSATSTQIVTPSLTDYLVKDSEKTDIYAGDKMVAIVQNRILTAINSAIASQSTATATMPFITTNDVPSSVIQLLSPRSGVPSTNVSITGSGISANSVVYFGTNYIVRSIVQDSFGRYSFSVPSIPRGSYDVAIKTGNAISNTSTFVITDPKNPLVRIQSVYPATINYGGTLTITGSGFTAENNTLVTTYQEFKNVPSSDGKTIVVQIAPESLAELAKVGRGTDRIPMSFYVVNEYGFSDIEKTINISI